MRADLYLGIVLVLFCLILFVELIIMPSKSFEGGGLTSSSFPFLVLLLTIILSVSLLIKGWISMRSAPKDDESAKPEKDSERQRRYLFPLITIFSVGGYLLLFPFLGFYPVTLIFLLVLGWLLSPRKKKSIILVGTVAVGMFIALYFTFEIWLRVLLPRGILF